MAYIKWAGWTQDNAVVCHEIVIFFVCVQCLLNHSFFIFLKINCLLSWFNISLGFSADVDFCFSTHHLLKHSSLYRLQSVAFGDLEKLLPVVLIQWRAHKILITSNNILYKNLCLNLYWKSCSLPSEGIISQILFWEIILV